MLQLKHLNRIICIVLEILYFPSLLLDLNYDVRNKCFRLQIRLFSCGKFLKIISFLHCVVTSFRTAGLTFPEWCLKIEEMFRFWNQEGFLTNVIRIHYAFKLITKLHANQCEPYLYFVLLPLNFFFFISST